VEIDEVVDKPSNLGVETTYQMKRVESFEANNGESQSLSSLEHLK
jgi:hypothetical protein